MSQTFCPNLIGDPAITFVGDAHTKFLNFATQGYNLALSNAQSLANFVPTSTYFTVSFDFAQQLTPFQRPVKPVINLDDFNIRPIEAPPLAPAFDPQTPDIIPVPEYTLSDPILAFGSAPGTPSPVLPTAPVRPSALVVPTAPTYNLPIVPTFEQLNLPAVPTITLPTFAGVRPTFVEPHIDENWSFTPAQYVSDLLDKLKAKNISMLNGEMALPPQVQNALFDGGRAKIEIETATDIEQANDEWASRGFSEPPGQLKGRIAMARQAGQTRVADYVREVTVKAFEESLANLRLALHEGIALEGVAVNLHIEEQKLLLQSAQFLRETSIAILNARVLVFNAQIEAYKADAQVLEIEIRAQLAYLELYRAQIEGEKLKGEVNLQRVQLYSEQMKALGVMADFYRAAVEGVKAQADVQKSVIESYKAEVDAFGTVWEAYGHQVDAYRSGVEAENIKSTVHRNLVDAYATRVGAVVSENTLVFDRERLRLSEHQQLVAVYAANLQRIDALLATERARLGAVAGSADAQARIYTAAGTVEASATAATDRSFELGLENAKTQAQFQVESARIRSSENVALTGLLIEVRKSLTDVAAQLAASSMSAVSYSAGLSSSRSNSISCSTDYNFSGETADGI